MFVFDVYKLHEIILFLSIVYFLLYFLILRHILTFSLFFFFQLFSPFSTMVKCGRTWIDDQIASRPVNNLNSRAKNCIDSGDKGTKIFIFSNWEIRINKENNKSKNNYVRSQNQIILTNGTSKQDWCGEISKLSNESPDERWRNMSINCILHTNSGLNILLNYRERLGLEGYIKRQKILEVK